MPTRHRALADDSRGSAYVEFLIAFLPTFILFMALWQLGEIAMTRLFVAHSAVAAARAAAVIIPQPDASGHVSNRLDAAGGGGSGARGAVEAAMAIALAPVQLQGWVAGATLTFPATPGASPPSTEQVSFGGGSAGDGDVAMVNVRVEVGFRCHMPLVDWFMCDDAGSAGRVSRIAGEASFPYQGARYDVDPPSPPGSG